ncbi:hypothetical protein AB0F03_12585 [Streptomyces sp. NPDC028722]|uniref:hypothetical protein n=1 Tax=Streptomyces sp. NPDC028722 TaxID=3155016 RepID=UPI0033CC730B
MLGLRRQDIDFEAGRFVPVKQVQRVKGAGLVLKDLKTVSSQAVLPLPEFCARVLEERRELQELERKIAGEHWSQEPDHDLIFSAEHGGIIDPLGFSRTFERLVRRAGVRRITVRLARHTCGTLGVKRSACSPNSWKIRSSADRRCWCQPWVSKDPRPIRTGGLFACGANRI